MAVSSRFAQSLRSPFQWFVVGGLLIFLALVFTASNWGISPRYVPASQALLMSRAIGLAMFQFAQDHGGAYPTGKSSTEVFQKLIDEHYVSDPAIFFVPSPKIPGKTQATSHVLKAENVCWDITAPLNDSSSDSLPVVFLTGYRINYVAGGSAVPLHPPSESKLPGIMVCYHSMSAWFHSNNDKPDGVVTNVIDQNFDPKGLAYRQLTPDGPLAP